MASLRVEQLSYKYGSKKILHSVDLSLETGKVVSVVGPSGSGKTTLMHLCGGLLNVTLGKVNNRFHKQAFAFQDARLLPWKTALDNIAFSLKANGISKKQRHQKAKEIAIQLGLQEEDLTKFPKDLSGGMRQRVAFARALVIEPEILFLDEPFSALDIGLKKELQSLLIKWVSEKNLSIFFITHDLSEAIQLSNEVLVLASNPGRIIKRIQLEKPQTQRNEEYVFQSVRELLLDADIIETFELNFKQRQPSGNL